MRRVDKGQSRGEERRLPAAGDGDRPRDDPAWEAAGQPFGQRQIKHLERVRRGQVRHCWHVLNTILNTTSLT